MRYCGSTSTASVSPGILAVRDWASRVTSYSSGSAEAACAGCSCSFWTPAQPTLLSRAQYACGTQCRCLAHGCRFAPAWMGKLPSSQHATRHVTSSSSDACTPHRTRTFWPVQREGGGARVDHKDHVLERFTPDAVLPAGNHCRQHTRHLCSPQVSNAPTSIADFDVQLSHLPELRKRATDKDAHSMAQRT